MKMVPLSESMATAVMTPTLDCIGTPTWYAPGVLLVYSVTSTPQTSTGAPRNITRLGKETRAMRDRQLGTSIA
jgi:hypothetical protein